MTRSGLLRRHIDVLVLGLPVANWKPRQAELMKIGSGPHPIPVPIAQRAQFGETLSVTVGKVIVVPQPVGALQHAVMNLPRTELRQDKRVRMVIDPGYNTFDWFVSVGVRPDLQRCGSLQGGVSQLLKLVANAAGARLGVGTLNLKEVEDGLASGSMLTQGKKLDMKEFEPIAQDEAREVVDRFLNAIDASLKIDIIHLTGGGASFYIKALREALPGYDIQVEPGTVMANARGFYLIGKTLADMK